LCPQENLEQCKSAAEFLLEPWILVQLPFQPVLLHQWSVALLAESLKFEKELQEMTFIPKYLHASVNKLTTMCNLMFQTALKFFVHYSYFIFDSDESFTNNIRMIFFDYMPEVMPVLEFVLSSKCGEILRVFAKATLESRKFDFKNTLEVKNGHYYSFCYNQNFWRKKSLVHSMCYRRVGILDSTDYLNIEDFEVRGDKSVVTASELEGCKRLIEEKFVKSGLVKGESKQFLFGLLDEAETRNKLIPLYRVYKLAVG